MPSIQKKLWRWRDALEWESLACAGIAGGFLLSGLLFLSEFAKAAAPLTR